MNEDRSLLPQLATRSNAVIRSVEWFFEPCWRGDRLMARVEGGRLSLTNGRGEPAPEIEREARPVIEEALRVDDALVDGIWTNMPFVGEGSAARILADAIAEEGLTDEVPDPIANESRHAFVALDLVELHGEKLHEVPYQERRRVLASLFDEGNRLRISPAVRAPLHNWLIAWRATGFEHYVAKHMNSRYTPGEIAEDWLQISTAEARGPSPVGRLFGVRPKKVVHIEDDGEAAKPPRI
jgi:bifunctional non-homologous end joining protein LigD